MTKLGYTRISRNISKRASIYKSPIKTFGFHFRKYEVVAPIFKGPIAFRGKQVIQYMTFVTSDFVEQITAAFPILYHIRHQRDLICTAKTIRTPYEVVKQIPILLIHAEIMTF